MCARINALKVLTYLGSFDVLLQRKRIPKIPSPEILSPFLSKGDFEGDKTKNPTVIVFRRSLRRSEISFAKLRRRSVTVWDHIFSDHIFSDNIFSDCKSFEVGCDDCCSLLLKDYSFDFQEWNQVAFSLPGCRPSSLHFLEVVCKSSTVFRIVRYLCV
ncbi:hypothetical protein YC2023_076951 [Brassica napus]